MKQHLVSITLTLTVAVALTSIVHADSLDLPNARLKVDHFKPTEVLSSDYCRGLVSDDENDQTSTKEAFEVLHFIARKRLAAGRLTVIDATNVQPDSRKPLVALAREFHVLPIAIVFDFPEKVCQERNRT